MREVEMILRAATKAGFVGVETNDIGQITLVGSMHRFFEEAYKRHCRDMDYSADYSRWNEFGMFLEFDDRYIKLQGVVFSNERRRAMEVAERSFREAVECCSPDCSVNTLPVKLFCLEIMRGDYVP